MSGSSCTKVSFRGMRRSFRFGGRQLHQDLHEMTKGQGYLEHVGLFNYDRSEELVASMQATFAGQDPLGLGASVQVRLGESADVRFAALEKKRP